MNSDPASSPSGLHRLRRTTSDRPSRPWKPLAFTILTLVLFALIVGRVFGDRLRPAVKVRTARVLLLPAGQEDSDSPAASTSELLFQSSGWIEPAPWPLRVAALADGIIKEVHFKEGDRVTKDQVLVRMVSEDVDLKITRLKSELKQIRLEAEAETAAVEVAEKELESAKARLTRAQSALKEAQDDWTRVKTLVEERVLSSAAKVRAEEEFNQRKADVREAESETQRALLDLNRRRHLAEAREQQVQTVQASLDTARLEKSRLVIRAPADGRVLRRFVEPGSKRMRGTEDPDSATVALLYDPEQLQVRVDVPLAEAGKLVVGQPATLTTALLPGREFKGTVTRIVGQADLQRNTLQAKVEIQEPHDRMRPDVLCRVAFYGMAPDTDSDTPAPSGDHALWIPADLVDASSSEAELWVVDPIEHTAHPRTVRLGTSTREGLRHVRDGLHPNERVVVDPSRPLAPGDRIRTIETASQDTP